MIAGRSVCDPCSCSGSRWQDAADPDKKCPGQRLLVPIQGWTGLLDLPGLLHAMVYSAGDNPRQSDTKY